MIGFSVMIVASRSQKTILCGSALYVQTICCVKIATKLLFTRIKWTKKEFQKVLALLKIVKIPCSNLKHVKLVEEKFQHKKIAINSQIDLTLSILCVKGVMIAPIYKQRRSLN